ncbi:MAG: asparagine synthase-related protein [Pirellulaceae bacterium]
MLVTSTDCFRQDLPEFSTHCDDGFEISWTGHAFIPGQRQGRDSIAEFANRLRRETVESVAVQLRGVYLCLVRNLATKTLDVFVDPAGLRAAYRTPTLACSSFLEIMNLGAEHYGAISAKGVVEWFALGGLYFGRTFATNVSTIGRDQILRFREGHVGYQLVTKLDMSLESQPVIGRLDYFESLAKALDGANVTVDLTGGVDSRYTAVMLKHFGCQFSVGLASRPDHPDAIVSGQIAKQLGVSQILVDHQWSDLEREIRQVYVDQDGISNPISLFRPHQYVRELKRQGVDVNVQSIGETYKDWPWYQDFPFYGSRKTNLQRFFNYRIYSIKLPKETFHADLQPLFMQWPDRFVQEMEAFRYWRNTTSYDAAIVFGKGPAAISKGITCRARFVGMSVPFFDLDLLREATQMSPWKRPLDRIYRHDMTRVNPDVARTKTIEGLTVSDQGWDLLADSLRMGKFVGKRVLKVAGRKLFGKSFFQTPADSTQFVHEVHRLKLLEDCVARLQRHNILSNEIARSVVHSRAGAIITLGLLLESLGDSVSLGD